MDSYIFWTIMLVVLAGLIAGATVFMRAYLGGISPSSLLFRQKTDRRLEVVDYAALDSRRKLILIRRDDVEHLLMTGGPVDVVIETNIAPQRRRSADIVEGPTAVYARPARPLGQAVGDN